MGNLILSIDVEGALSFNRICGEIEFLSLFCVLLVQISEAGAEIVTHVDKYDQLLENQ